MIERSSDQIAEWGLFVMFCFTLREAGGLNGCLWLGGHLQGCKAVGRWCLWVPEAEKGEKGKERRISYPPLEFTTFKFKMESTSIYLTYLPIYSLTLLLSRTEVDFSTKLQYPIAFIPSSILLIPFMKPLSNNTSAFFHCLVACPIVPSIKPHY